MERQYSKVSPEFVPGLAYAFLNTKDFTKSFCDPGLDKAWKLAMRWVGEEKRSSNQYTYQYIEENSDFTKDQLIGLSVYFYLVSSSVSVPIDLFGDIEEHNCWIPPGAVNKGGYVRIPFLKGYIFAHEFIGTIMFGRAPNGYEWSHLCNNKKCCRPTHITAEPHQTNIERIKCRGIEYRPPNGVTVYSDNYVIVYCDHRPTCLHK